MHLFTPYRRGLLAATVVVICFSLGCSSTAPQVRTAPETGAGNQGLTPAEDRHAQALAHYATALSLASEQGVSAALPEYVKSYELDPGNLPLALFLSEIYHSRHELTNGISILQDAAKANPQSGEPWVAMGMVYGNEDATNAVAAYKHALKIEPTHYGAMRALTETYLAQNNTNDLVAFLDQSFHKHSNEAIYWTVLGDLYNQTLHLKPSLASKIDAARSLQAYEKAMTLSPDDPDILARLGDSYMDTNNFKAAAETYARLIAVQPNNPQLRERLAAIYLKTNQKEKAIALYKQLIKNDPVRYEFYNVLAELYEDTEKPEEALNYFEQSLKLNPDQSDAYLSICELQRGLKHPADALKTLDAWKKKFPVDWRIPYMHAFIDLDNKDYAKAIASYADVETLAREAPQEVELKAPFFFGFGSAYERAGDIAKAAPMFRKAIEMDPKMANAYNYLGYMWAEHNTNLTESLELIQKAVQLDPDNGAYLDSLGWVYFQLGRNSEALPQLQRAVALLEKDVNRDKEDRQEDSVVYDHLAQVLLKLGKTGEAVQTWKHAMEIDPDNKDIPAKIQKYNQDHSAAPK